MDLKISKITSSTAIGAVSDVFNSCKAFDINDNLHDIWNHFSSHTPDAVVITENTLPIGILTLKDMVKTLNNSDNLPLPVKEFMSSPLHTFDVTTTITDVLDTMQEVAFDKIVVTQDGDLIIGIIDRRDLLSLCYTQLTPLIKHEYNMIQSMLGLVGEGERGLLQMATTDTLTGVGNRRLFEEVFQAHQSLGERYDVNLFLLLFDIDNFKGINDTFGHKVGDSVLKELASLVGQSIRKSDIFARWGGEEFAILLRYSDPMAVMKVAEQIRRKIDEHSFESIVHITCSFGLSAIMPHETLETVFERADKALYRAKSDGKNVVRVEKL